MSILQHIGFICDGNATWAQVNNKNEFDGYKSGINTIFRIINDLNERNIKYATFYTFSTENWSRPQQWISKFLSYVNNALEDILNNRIAHTRSSMKFIGNMNKVDEHTKQMMKEIEIATSGNSGTAINVAFSYGGRDEIVRAIHKALSSCKSTDDINEDLISQNMDTYPAPDPDIIVRTKGMNRLSNFMIWQSSYSEYISSDLLWPDFNADELDSIISEYNNRIRTFGKK